MLPESAPQSQHELFQVNPMFVRESLLAQNMVRIRILPVVRRTQRNRREV